MAIPLAPFVIACLGIVCPAPLYSHLAACHIRKSDTPQPEKTNFLSLAPSNASKASFRKHPSFAAACFFSLDLHCQSTLGCERRPSCFACGTCQHRHNPVNRSLRKLMGCAMQWGGQDSILTPASLVSRCMQLASRLFLLVKYLSRTNLCDMPCQFVRLCAAQSIISLQFCLPTHSSRVISFIESDHASVVNARTPC